MFLLRWVSLSSPSVLAVLEACDGAVSVREMVDEMEAELEMRGGEYSEQGADYAQEFAGEGTDGEGGWADGEEEGEEEGEYGEGVEGAGEVAAAVDQALRELYRLRLIAIEE